jgi:acyl-CoA hydrolase
MSKPIMTYRKLVMPEDENPAKRLFGGRLMQWADEATALYAMCQMRTKSVVTLKISEILFKNPAQSGDILEFWTRNTRIGRTSLTVECIVTRKHVGLPLRVPKAPLLDHETYLGDPAGIILSCEFVFVSIDKKGKPTPHALASPGVQPVKKTSRRKKKRSSGR